MFGKLDGRPDITVPTFLILLIGTVGNILSLVVLCRKRLRKKNIGIYLIALCVSDLFVLYISLFNTFLAFAGVYGDSYDKFNCQVIRFFRSFFLDCSSWITVVITIQRTIAVYRPLSTYLRSSSGCTSQVKVLSILFVVLVVISAVYANSYTFENQICMRPHKILHFFLFSFVYSFFPASILIICNVAIVLKIYRRPAVGQTPLPAHNNAQTVRLVLAINMMFLIFTLPPSLLFNSTDFLKNNPDDIIVVLSIIMTTNNAFNFILYMLASRSFQEELLSMRKPKRKQEIWAISKRIDSTITLHSSSNMLP